ncbi:TetR family transcriptional regulator [Amycolatopsis sulphurea]|uniref:TetR family transcriptional regulator n=1 Tax=Amycolatopsis sulphurea TaxID=76022 RepID=A0A2A9FHU1_9PSEU|nr:TetR/AcrR family transcriptional regulator [Amycolatopsis sulphurea]PFG50728.1 TetR family transcriptional regulator [Amycolatopsis sulphurea]
MATPAPVNTSSRGAQRKMQIISVAAGLFNERGYHETSMDLIAAHVGIRKASLYHYFSSKDEILIVIHEEMIDLIVERQEQRAAAAALGPKDMLLAVMTDLVGLMETHPGHLRVFFEHYRELPMQARNAIAGKRDQYHQYLIDILEAGVSTGEFGPMDTRMTSFAILGMCNWTYQWFHPGEGWTAEQVARHFWQLFIDGAAPKP